jgi:transketolase
MWTADCSCHDRRRSIIHLAGVRKDATIDLGGEHEKLDKEENRADSQIISRYCINMQKMDPIPSSQQLQLKSIHYRKTVLSIIKRARAGHTGGSLSSVDILNVLYNRILRVTPTTFHDLGRDRFVQSKGQSVEALYTVLAERGFFPESDLETLNHFGSHLIGHPTRKVNGVEQNTGALGHGLSFAVGTALAGKIDQRAFRVFTLLGDGELAEGSNWEAAMTAGHYQLDNLVVIVDRNGLQITGPTEEVVRLEPLRLKFEAFGFAVHECDGNSIPELLTELESVPFVRGQPSLLLARTRKGCGISFMEDSVRWHHRVPNDQEFEEAIKELERAEASMA